MNHKPIAAAVVIAGSLLLPVALRADESPEERAARLERMSPSKKEELARKKARFDKLSPEEQARLKKLCNQIKSRPDADELESVMSRYHEWLKTLSSNELAELRDLPEEERLDYIKRVKKQQQQKEFLQIAREASPEDLETVFEWLKDFVYGRREQLLRSLHGDFGRRVASMDEKDRQTLVLIHIVVNQPPHSPLRPGKDDVEELIPRLSPPLQRVFNESPDVFTRIQMVSIWSWGALWSKSFPEVTGDKLASYFGKLPARERDRLEKLPAKDRELELKKLYYRDNFFKRMGVEERRRGSRDKRD